MAFRLRAWFDEITGMGSIRGTRFRNGDRPPRNTFKDLTDSVVFRSETDDRAKEDDGVLTLTELNGHVVASNDAQAKANAAKLLDRTLAVQPSQLPTVNEDDDLTITGGVPYTGETIEVEVNPADDTKNDFLLRFSTTFKTWLQSLVTFVDDSIASLASDILALDGRVSQNETDIAQNQSDIAQNTSDIATNTSNIATNTSDIATNASNIATNTSNIAQNTSDISALENDVQNISDSVSGTAVISGGVVVEDSAARDANNPTAKYVKCTITFPADGTYSLLIFGSLIIDIDLNNIGAGDNTSFETKAFLYESAGNVLLNQSRQSENLTSAVYERLQHSHCMIERSSIVATQGQTKEYFIGLTASDAAGNWIGSVGRPFQGQIQVLAFRG